MEVAACRFDRRDVAGDSLEHYVFCPVIAFAARLYLSLQLGAVARGGVGMVIAAHGMGAVVAVSAPRCVPMPRWWS